MIPLYNKEVYEVLDSQRNDIQRRYFEIFNKPFDDIPSIQMVQEKILIYPEIRIGLFDHDSNKPIVADYELDNHRLQPGDAVEFMIYLCRDKESQKNINTVFGYDIYTLDEFSNSTAKQIFKVCGMDFDDLLVEVSNALKAKSTEHLYDDNGRRIISDICDYYSLSIRSIIGYNDKKIRELLAYGIYTDILRIVHLAQIAPVMFMDYNCDNFDDLDLFESYDIAEHFEKLYEEKVMNEVSEEEFMRHMNCDELGTENFIMPKGVTRYEYPDDDLLVYKSNVGSTFIFKEGLI